jgi:hypothetical protein
MLPGQLILYKAATECFRHSGMAESPVETAVTMRMDPGTTPFVWGITDIITAGKKFTGNAMAALRKLSSHPLLMRVHFTNSDVVHIAARIIDIDNPGKVPGKLLVERTLQLGPHTCRAVCDGPATKEYVRALALGNQVSFVWQAPQKTFFTKHANHLQRVASVAERMLTMSDYQLHQVAVDEAWPALQLPPSCFLESNKVQLLLQLSDKVGSDAKIVVFSQFTTVLDLIEEAFAIKGVSSVRLDGSTAVSARMAIVDEFQTDTSIRFFLTSTKAGGVGLNLTAARYAVLLDPDFNPTNDAQCEDRIHRIGQTGPCRIIKVATKHSIETHIAAIAARKIKLQGAVLSNSGQDRISSKDEEREALRNAILGDRVPHP